MKESSLKALRDAGHKMEAFGAYSLNPGDDYPKFVIPQMWSVALGEVERGIAISGSGIGASFTANKVPAVRLALIMRVTVPSRASSMML